MDLNIYFRNVESAFNNVLDCGFMSDDPKSDVYVGNYMYMYSLGDVDYFKHINTRKYESYINLD